MFRFLTAFSASLAITSLGACSPDEAPQGSLATDRQTSDKTSPDTDQRPEPAISPVSRDFSELPAPYDRADYSLGRRTFKLCGACHTVREGAPHLVGPNLHGLFQRQAGSVQDFKYSEALSGAQFDWTPEKVDEWLANPNEFLPGNNMSFVGVRRPGDRTAVIAYLMLESGYRQDGTVNDE